MDSMGGNHGEGELDMGGCGGGEDRFVGGPAGSGGRILGMHPFGFNGGGTMGRRNSIWGGVEGGTQ